MGFIFGILQMALYIAYKDTKKVGELAPEHVIAITKLGGAVEIYTIDSVPPADAGEAAGLADRDAGDEKEKKEMKHLEV